MKLVLAHDTALQLMRSHRELGHEAASFSRIRVLLMARGDGRGSLVGTRCSVRGYGGNGVGCSRGSLSLVGIMMVDIAMI